MLEKRKVTRYERRF